MTPPRDCDITEPSLREDVSRIEGRLEDAPTRQILVVEGTHDGAAVSSLGIRQGSGVAPGVSSHGKDVEWRRG